MKRKVIVSVLSSVLTCVVLLLLVAKVGAQGPDGGTSQLIDPAAPLGGSAAPNGTPISSTFTYQGQLKSSGSAVTSSCDFQFGLWDMASGGLQVGVTQTLTAVAVTNGLFTVPLNFGANAFTGDARWLAIAVRCPAGGGAYATLNPRQAVTPAPYALALPGFWTKPGANAPSIIGGYVGNAVNGAADGSVIAGGGSPLYGANIISGTTVDGSTISGGVDNQISGNAYESVIGGGRNNTISGINATYSTIGGGWRNTISGAQATIPGGDNNTAAGDDSFAAGHQAKANHQGAFVWGDSTPANFASTGNDQFLIRANGGMGVGTNAPAAQLHVSSSGGDAMPQVWVNQSNLAGSTVLRSTIGNNYNDRWDIASNVTNFTIYSGHFDKNPLTLTPGDSTDYMVMGNFAHLTAGGAWTNASDRNVKANFAPVDGRAVLDKVLRLPLSTWNYKAENAATRHLGPMAQDFYATFGLGGDDKSISTIDPAGVSLAAIQGLYQVVQDKDRRITQLENEVAQLKTDQPFNPFNLISPLLSAVALGGVIVIGLRQKRGGQA